MLEIRSKYAAFSLLLLGLLLASIPSDQHLVAEETPAAKKPTERANRLAAETSPYLLLHAHNPVDWYPWGSEALDRAKKENKPIFLSVGYSSCHWCHVMERESFLDPEIATLLNKNFICIKVDREERPDIDTIYMTAVQTYLQITTGRRGGGWPMTVFLTPDGNPFFGGTYFPAREGDREGLTGFLTLVTKVSEMWTKSPDKLREDASTLARFIKIELEGPILAPLVKLDSKLITAVEKGLTEQFDERYGGFGYDPIVWQRPKFPEPSNLVFLLEIAKKTDENPSRAMLTSSLDQMAMGGIYDHVGGGFHRYSVDRMWRIPHFEKMLYDNGQLLSVYSEAYALTGDESYRRIVTETADFLLREMRDEQGGFYAALDAETEGVEGKFYRWEKSEIEALLTKEEFELYAAVYGLTRDPNFEESFYVLQLRDPLRDLAKERSINESSLVESLRPIHEKLLAARDKRKRPLTDTKVLTAENGLAISGLATAGRILKEPRYIEAAERAATFLLTNNREGKEGDAKRRLLRTYSGGSAKLNAYVNDYAMLVEGLIALHEATGDKKWLDEAVAITELQIELFHDKPRGGFYFTSGDHEALLARVKETIDGAIPAGNSVSAMNLLKLAKIAEKPAYFALAEGSIQTAAATMEASPTMSPRLATALDRLLVAKGASDLPELAPTDDTSEKTSPAPQSDSPAPK